MTDNALAIIEQPAGQELALPEHITESAREYIKEARASNTRRAYTVAWRMFALWCTANGRTALPATPETLAGWITALADGADGGKPRSRATISLYLSAVITAQRTAGHEFDRSNAILAETWRGISRSKAREGVERQAAPLLGKDLQTLLEGLGGRAIDVRDAALLSLGWAGALRRSELVGLDWHEMGEGVGFLRIDERGAMVTLATSKASQDNAASVIIPAADMPTAIARILAWADLAQLQPGQSVFRSIDKGGRISPDRLGDGSVSLIMKRRVYAYALEKGKSKAEAEQLASLFSGHSMRAGFATTAADLPLAQLAKHTRHRSLEVLIGYIREAEAWNRSALKTVGF
jgi:integrase